MLSLRVAADGRGGDEAHRHRAARRRFPVWHPLYHKPQNFTVEERHKNIYFRKIGFPYNYVITPPSPAGLWV